MSDSEALNLDYSKDSKDTIKVKEEDRYIVKSDRIAEHLRIRKEIAEGKSVIEVSKEYLSDSYRIPTVAEQWKEANATKRNDKPLCSSVEEEMREYSKKCQDQFYKNIAKRIRDKYNKEEQ